MSGEPHLDYRETAMLRAALEQHGYERDIGKPGDEGYGLEMWVPVEGSLAPSSVWYFSARSESRTVVTHVDTARGKTIAYHEALAILEHQ